MAAELANAMGIAFLGVIWVSASVSIFWILWKVVDDVYDNIRPMNRWISWFWICVLSVLMVLLVGINIAGVLAVMEWVAG